MFMSQCHCTTRSCYGNLSSIALYKTRLAFVVFLWIVIFVGGSDGKASAHDEGDLGQEDPLEKEMATHSSILAWKIPWMEESCGLQSMGVAKSRTRLRDFTSLYLLCLFFFWGSQIFQVSFIIKV